MSLYSFRYCSSYFGENEPRYLFWRLLIGWVAKLSYLWTHLKNKSLACRTVVVQEYSELVIWSFNNLCCCFRRRLLWVSRNHPELPLQHQGFCQKKGVCCKLKEKTSFRASDVYWKPRIVSGVTWMSLELKRAKFYAKSQDMLFIDMFALFEIAISWSDVNEFHFCLDICLLHSICSLWIHIVAGRSRNIPLHIPLLSVTVKYENVPRILFMSLSDCAQQMW